jgi:hypothetical protein
MRSFRLRKLFTDNFEHRIHFKGTQRLFHIIKHTLEIEPHYTRVLHALKVTIVSKGQILLELINFLKLLRI